MRRALAIAFLIAGCTPTPAFVLADTPETLARGEVALAGGVGAGIGGTGNGNPVGEAGAIARVRAGVGANQEFSVEGAAVGGSVWSVEARLGWKIAPTERLAVLFGAGVTVTGGSPAVGTDLSIVAATRPRGPGRFYGGLRLGVAVPATSDPLDAGVDFVTTLPLGYAFEPRPRVRLFVEAGLIASAAVANPGFGVAPTAHDVYNFYGAYLAVVPAVLFRRR